ncbi:MAG TPA: sensor histidine kinase [Chitinophagaceae bacterium]|nr:sensor histidine kinase [Chitinophagaceae bacterium]
MEYDNDKIIRGRYPQELAGWVLLAVLYPLVNGLAAFPRQPATWLLLLLLQLPAVALYIGFGNWIVPRLLFTRKYVRFGIVTVGLLCLIVILQLLWYAMLPLDFYPAGPAYFFFFGDSLPREIGWAIINTSIAISIAFIRKTLEAAATVEEVQKENTFFKLRYYRTQLQPHFLFNTLNSIYSLSLTNTSKTPEVIIRLSDIMRFLIYECNEDKIPLDKEIEFIRNYIEIERLRYDADIQFSIEGDTEGIMIEPFLFISFIENGFKHAIDNSFDKPFIYITLKVGEETIALNVINNTQLALETQAKKMQGKGLANSKTVLEILYPDAYALDIIQTEKKERRESRSRWKNAQERLQKLYPDAHTLDVILNNNTFTVSLILTNGFRDKMHDYRR